MILMIESPKHLKEMTMSKQGTLITLIKAEGNQNKADLPGSDLPLADGLLTMLMKQEVEITSRRTLSAENWPWIWISWMTRRDRLKFSAGSEMD